MKLKDINGEKWYIGSLSVPDGFVDITDPCYEKNVWCRLNHIAVVPGEYQCYVWETDENRISAIAIVSDYASIAYNDSVLNDFGSIGVDAGLAGFFINKPDYTDEEWEQFCDDIEGEKWLLTDDSFFSESGYGDGGYDVYVSESDNGSADVVMILFIDD